MLCRNAYANDSIAMAEICARRPNIDCAMKINSSAGCGENEGHHKPQAGPKTLIPWRGPEQVLGASARPFGGHPRA